MAAVADANEGEDYEIQVPPEIEVSYDTGTAHTYFILWFTAFSQDYSKTDDSKK